MSIFANIAGDVIEDVARSAVKKAADGLVAQGKLTAAEEPTFVEGILLDIKVGLEMYQDTQAKTGG